MKRGTETGSLLQWFVSVMKKEEMCCNIILGKVESTCPHLLEKIRNLEKAHSSRRQWALPPAFQTTLIISQAWKLLPMTRHIPALDTPVKDTLAHFSPNLGIQKLLTCLGLPSVKTFWTIHFAVKIIQCISVTQLLKQLWKMNLCAVHQEATGKLVYK